LDNGSKNKIPMKPKLAICKQWYNFLQLSHENEAIFERK
jgi:hypothetical protein